MSTWYLEESELDDFNIIYEVYECGNYEGEAFVLMENDKGELFECHGSHCSCYGMEDQWDPEETSLKALEYRAENGDYYGFVSSAIEALENR